MAGILIPAGSDLGMSSLWSVMLGWLASLPEHRLGFNVVSWFRMPSPYTTPGQTASLPLPTLLHVSQPMWYNLSPRT